MPTRRRQVSSSSSHSASSTSVVGSAHANGPTTRATPSTAMGGAADAGEGAVEGVELQRLLPHVSDATAASAGADAPTSPPGTLEKEPLVPAGARETGTVPTRPWYLNLLYFSVFLDIVAVGCVIPMLPYVAKEVGADAIQIGFMSAVYGTCQLVGGTLMGRLSDVAGRKTVLLLSCVGGMVSYTMVGLADSFMFLLLSRVPVGLLKQSVSLSQAYVADETPGSTRARELGRLSACAGLGFIVGPLLGGLVSRIDENMTGFVAASIFTVDFAVLWLWLPEPKRHTHEDSVTPTPAPGWRALLRALVSNRAVTTLFAMKFLMDLSLFIMHNTFSLLMQDRYKLEVEQTSYVLAYMGVLAVMSQGLGVPFLTNRCAMPCLIRWAAVTATASLAAYAMANTVPLVLIALFPLSFSFNMLRTGMTTLITHQTGKDSRGSLLGLFSSVEAFSRVCAPLAGGFLLHDVGVMAPGLVGAALCAVLSVLTRVVDMAAMTGGSTKGRE